MTRKNNKNTLTLEDGIRGHRVQYNEGHSLRFDKWQIFLQYKQKGEWNVVTVYKIHSESHDKIQALAGHLGFR